MPSLRRLPKSLIIGLIFAALVLALIIYSSMGLRRVSCEACVVFDGQTVCRPAEGSSREEAIRTATDNACASLTRDMAESIRCSNTPPKTLKCSGFY